MLYWVGWMLLKPGQRWRYIDPDYDYIVQVVDPKIYACCVVVQNLKGQRKIGDKTGGPETKGDEYRVLSYDDKKECFGYSKDTVLSWSWIYLVGQDAPE